MRLARGISCPQCQGHVTSTRTFRAGSLQNKATGAQCNSTTPTLHPMPVPVRTPSPAPLFPPLTVGEVDAARTSAWYDTFEDITFAASIVDIDGLGEREAFLEVGSAAVSELTPQWLHSDSIFMPEDDE